MKVLHEVSVSSAYTDTLTSAVSNVVKYAKVLAIGCAIYIGVPSVVGAIGYTLRFFYKKTYGIHFINATNNTIDVVVLKATARPGEASAEDVRGRTQLEPHASAILDGSVSFLGSFRRGFIDSVLAFLHDNTLMRRAVTPVVGNSVPMQNNVFLIRDDGIYLSSETREILVALWGAMTESTVNR